MCYWFRMLKEVWTLLIKGVLTMLKEIESYNRFKGYKEKYHIALTEDSLKFFNVKDKEELQKLYEVDDFLNNIPLKLFYSLAASYILYQRKGSIMELVCAYKFCLVYDILKIEPPTE